MGRAYYGTVIWERLVFSRPLFAHITSNSKGCRKLHPLLFVRSMIFIH